MNGPIQLHFLTESINNMFINQVPVS